MKTTLITGSTDGIGKMTAIELAKHDYTIHLLGRNKERGIQVLNKLKSISPDKEHRFYQVDLSTVNSNLDFINEYKSQHESLDLLILNALAVPNKTVVTEDKLEITFAVGYLSRYIFSLQLNSLLENGNDARVIHIGEGSRASEIDYSQVHNIEPSEKKLSIMGVYNLSMIPYTADGIFTFNVNQKTSISIPHEYYYPGVVDTKQVRELDNVLLRSIFRFIGKLTGLLIQPQESAEVLVKHILNTRAIDVASKYYATGKLSKTSKKMAQSENIFNRLIAFSERITNLKIK